MRTFGPFTLDRRLRSDGVSATFSASDDGAALEVRIFEQEARGAALDALEAAWAQADLVSAGAKAWAPIHNFGGVDSVAFVATPACDLTLDELLRSRAAGDERRLWAIVAGILDGLIEIEDLAGRPHGALSASSVRVDLSPREPWAKAVLDAPAPQSKLRVHSARADDASALGELVVHLATGMEAETLGGWPLPDAAGWRRLRRGSGWRELANSLLDPGGAHGASALREARARIEPLRPRSHGKPVLAASAAMLVVVISAVVLLVTCPWCTPKGTPANIEQLVSLMEMNHYWTNELEAIARRDQYSDEELAAILHVDVELAGTITTASLIDRASALPAGAAEALAGLLAYSQDVGLVEAAEILGKTQQAKGVWRGLNDSDTSNESELSLMQDWLDNDADAAVSVHDAYLAVHDARTRLLDAVDPSGDGDSVAREQDVAGVVGAAIRLSMQLETGDMGFVATLLSTSDMVAASGQIDRDRVVIEPVQLLLEVEPALRLTDSWTRLDDELDTCRTDAISPLFDIESRLAGESDRRLRGPGEILEHFQTASGRYKEIQAKTGQLVTIIDGALDDTPVVHLDTFINVHGPQIDVIEPDALLEQIAAWIQAEDEPSRFVAPPNPREGRVEEFLAQAPEIEASIAELHKLGNEEDAAKYRDELQLLRTEATTLRDDDLAWVLLYEAEITQACDELGGSTESLASAVDESVTDAKGDPVEEARTFRTASFDNVLDLPTVKRWLPEQTHVTNSRRIEEAWESLREEVISQEPEGVYGMRRGVGAVASTLIAIDAALPYDATLVELPGIDADLARAAFVNRRDETIRVVASDLHYQRDPGRNVSFDASESEAARQYAEWYASASAVVRRASSVHAALTDFRDLSELIVDSADPGETRASVADVWRLVRGSAGWDDLSASVAGTSGLVDQLEALPAPDAASGDIDALRAALGRALDEVVNPVVGVGAWRRAVTALDLAHPEDLGSVLDAHERARELVRANSQTRLEDFDATWKAACARTWQNALDEAPDSSTIGTVIAEAGRVFADGPPEYTDAVLDIEPRSRLNIYLAQLKNEESLTDLRELDVDEAQGRLQATIDVMQQLDQGADVKPFEDLLERSRKQEQGESVDADSLGPEAEWIDHELAGERTDDKTDPFVREYHMAWGETMTFRLVQPSGTGPSAYVCTTETTTETFAAIMKVMGSRPDPTNPDDATRLGAYADWIEYRSGRGFETKDEVPSTKSAQRVWYVSADTLITAPANQDERWSWVNVEHPDLPELIRILGSERDLYANERPEWRTVHHPVNSIGPGLAMAVASRIGCRLPSPEEMGAALDDPNRDASTPNLRDDRFAAQRDHVLAIRGNPDNKRQFQVPREPDLSYPDAGGFWPRGFENRRTEENAIVFPDAAPDGSIYPRPVPTEPTDEFCDLIGNVAEWVCGVKRETNDRGEPIRREGPLDDLTVHGILRDASAEGSIGVMGCSAISCPEAVPDPRALCVVAIPFHQYPDVGFRLAFTGELQLGVAFAARISNFGYIPPAP